MQRFLVAFRFKIIQFNMVSTALLFIFVKQIIHLYIISIYWWVGTRPLILICSAHPSIYFYHKSIDSLNTRKSYHSSPACFESLRLRVIRQIQRFHFKIHLLNNSCKYKRYLINFVNKPRRPCFGFRVSA